MEKQSIVENIKRFCKAKKTSIAAVERELGFGNGSIRKWDGASPTYERIAAVARLLGVSVQDLTGEEKEKPAANAGGLDAQLDGIDFALFGEVKDLTEAQKRDVLRFVKFIKDENKGDE